MEGWQEGASRPALASSQEEENSFLTLAEISNFTLGMRPKIHPMKHLELVYVASKW